MIQRKISGQHPTVGEPGKYRIYELPTMCPALLATIPGGGHMNHSNELEPH